MTQPPQIQSHCCIKKYVDESIDNATLLRLNHNEKLNIPNQDYITLNSAFTSPDTIIHIPIKNQHLVRNNQDNNFNNYKLTNISSVSVTHEAIEDENLVTLGYVKSLHEDNERNRRDIGLSFYDENSELVKNNQNNDFNNNKIINVQSIEINDTPTFDNHVLNKKYVDDNFILKSDSSIVKNNQNNAFNNNWLFDLESIYLNQDPKFPLQVATKQYVDKIKPVITIWAEESASLNNDSYEWSWGNGGASSGYGYPMMAYGRILRAGLTINPINTSATVEIFSGGNSIGTFDKILDQRTTITIFSTPLEVNQGDFITFKTKTETGTQSQNIASLLIELDL